MNVKCSICYLYNSDSDDEETEGHAPIFLTYAKLAENAGKLNQQLSGLRAQASSNKYRQQDMLTALYVVIPTHQSCLKSTVFCCYVSSDGCLVLPLVVSENVSSMTLMMSVNLTLYVTLRRDVVPG